MGPPRRHSLDRSTTMTGIAPPPTQVFTRGRTGSVKTRPQQRAAQRRATSMDPTSRSRQTRPRYPSKRSVTSHVSIDNMSYAAASDLSEDHSVHSAPSVPPSPVRRDRSDHTPDRRDPSASRASPSIMKQQHTLGKREISPDRTIDIQKQHVRTTRKIVEGRFSSVRFIDRLRPEVRKIALFSEVNLPLLLPFGMTQR
jgi:hypothetical protein